MKKFFYLALFMPVMFASCSQEDKAENKTDIPTVKNVSFKVDALPAANLYGEQGTRVWSGTTLEWEAAGGVGPQTTDRISLVYHGGFQTEDINHPGQIISSPFQSEPFGNIIYLTCQESQEGGTLDTAPYLPWTASGTIAAGKYTAFYPFVANVNPVTTGTNNLPVKFDISEQTINTNEFAAYRYTGKSIYLNDGIMDVAEQKVITDDTELSIRLNPVSSLMHLVLSDCPNVTFTRIEIAGVGTGFEFYPQENKSFGFSAEDYTKQKTAAELVASGWGKNYQEGTITLTGEATPENGVLEVFAWYLPVVEASNDGVSITLYDAQENAYGIVDMPNMAEVHEGAHLTRFNSGVTIRRAIAAIQ